MNLPFNHNRAYDDAEVVNRQTVEALIKTYGEYIAIFMPRKQIIHVQFERFEGDLMFYRKLDDMNKPRYAAEHSNDWVDITHSNLILAFPYANNEDGRLVRSISGGWGLH
jgi:hypothetical protein